MVANERNNNRDTQIESTSEMTDLLEIYTLNIGSYQFEPRIINPTEGKNKENSLHTVKCLLFALDPSYIYRLGNSRGNLGELEQN